MILRRSYASTASITSRVLCYQPRRWVSTPATSQELNAPLDLDPSLKHLLRDANMSLLKHKSNLKSSSDTPPIKELEVLDFDESSPERNMDYDGVPLRKERKSPQAKFGSNNIGSVTLPRELQYAIEGVIEDCDKPRLHEDAKRLFHRETSDHTEYWDTNYNVLYKNRRQASSHAYRDSVAFASIALPAHYSAIYAVLDNVKNRLGEEWKINHVLEWGSGVGSGFWASMHAFQHPLHHGEADADFEPSLSQSSVSSYFGFDKRSGLSSMAKKMLKDIDLGSRTVIWGARRDQPKQWEHNNKSHTLALSAFYLSSLKTIASKKELVKEMWDSGAEVIILLDHGTSQGFANIIEAREYLLQLGKLSSEDAEINDNTPVGCYIVAPCPHEKFCPLLDSSNLRCFFSQRLHRPAFLRKTKHAKAGHEDVGYSYIVIRRGQRPVPFVSHFQTRDKHDLLERDNFISDPSIERIRSEAYNWPRLVFPPLKRTGHAILDVCSPEGKIMRMTVPRSQGKQDYYDARKSSWGDIFPHKPKNLPQVRFQAYAKSDQATLPGSDIGKRRINERNQGSTSYEKISANLKESRKIKKSRNYIDDV